MKFKTLGISVLLIVIFTFSRLDICTAQESTNQLVSSKQILKTETTWNGQNVEYPATDDEEITALHIEFVPGSETPWHRHPVPSLAYIISGELEVIVRNGDRKIFKKGDAFAEVINTWHYGKNIGSEPVRLVVFYVGEKDVELTELMSDTEEK